VNQLLPYWTGIILEPNERYDCARDRASGAGMIHFLRAPSDSAGSLKRRNSSGSDGGGAGRPPFAAITSFFGASKGKEGGASPPPSPKLIGQADRGVLDDLVSSAASKVRSSFGYMVTLTQSGIHKDYVVREVEYGKGHYGLSPRPLPLGVRPPRLDGSVCLNVTAVTAGVVKFAERRRDGRPAAVKILPKRNSAGDRELTLIEREIDVMREIDHPNCIRMYDWYESKSHFYIVMELVTGGQLLERIIAKDHYSETEAANCFVQIISAVKYLHQIGIVHR